MERWHEWDYIALFMDVFWELSGGKDLLRPSWRRSRCEDVLAVLGELRVLPRRGVEPATSVEFLRTRMGRASPKALSDKTGYSREYLSRLKSGQRSNPTFEAFVRIVLALDIGFPLLASITSLRHHERDDSTQKNTPPKKRTKRSSNPQQRNADDFWGFRITFWVAKVRDLEALRRGEVTLISGQVTPPNQPEVTPGDRQVTDPDRQVTPARRPEVTPGDRQVTPAEARDGAAERRTFVAFDSEEEDPSPEFNLLMGELAEAGPYPMTLARVAEDLDARDRYWRERRAKERRRERKRNAEPQDPKPGAEPRAPDGESSRPADRATDMRTTHGVSGLRPTGEMIPVIFRGVEGYFVPLEPKPEPSPRSHGDAGGTDIAGTDYGEPARQRSGRSSSRLGEGFKVQLPKFMSGNQADDE